MCRNTPEFIMEDPYVQARSDPVTLFCEPAVIQANVLHGSEWEYCKWFLRNQESWKNKDQRSGNTLHTSKPSAVTRPFSFPRGEKNKAPFSYLPLSIPPVTKYLPLHLDTFFLLGVGLAVSANTRQTAAFGQKGAWRWGIALKTLLSYSKTVN